ncbi:cytochrome d ubiquinol oxidase subunit II [Rhodobacter capsulatus]|jgi:cytochrome d ubiquinol oxidase subunit II|uniref:Cytochrome d ubiquinol oxidase, subunit II n=1 Tax=Rhodobacter capsulatus (strain ATCC BAA-309 / NBRC 16581 / SB1003) TaxID=272942 RepID=D5AQL9_RHOCB|nr:cytochrome d ubiquinol oxidase subunit II [Rhodobacter capsulatus]ADE86808.1 cytochrome d ubiquinol oxidase, subunit II [Rhodobacter capsulatus SB 1003]ETD00353.1 cytochrome BD oxidase subunit II [Rhodobacter capsulatus DE442]ETD74693.1 cytochrome BD oxidase subunit II [Rhodobacter capsulatus R121]ETD83776.1 cytochrome BD oxidase subunit II [Rhodobacter capsulatus YW1]ETD87452.1 cytochrome BD oxidase subunit II [Rhodobacter capsulatus B6]
MILHELLSYDLLRVIWWVLLGVLLIGLAATDGFDMGVAALNPFVAKSDAERRVVINTIGPVWEGNQVWLILGGGAIFAAWPPLYAVSFSGFYLAMFLVLAALILRPVGFKYRNKRESAVWRTRWDWALVVGGAVPALIFGVAVGNVLQGVPFTLDETLLPVYPGNPLTKLLGLLNPFALFVGVVSLSMHIAHGAAWLVLKTEGAVQARARRIGSWAGVLTIVTFALAGVWLAFGIPAYQFVTAPDPLGPSNPLLSEVVRGGSWIDAYQTRPWIAVAPALAVLGLGGAVVLMRLWSGWAVTASMIGIFGVISTVGLSMFPFILPSSLNPSASLTVWDSSSSQMTLFIMLVSTVIFMPIILAYTSWVYKVLWGKVRPEDISRNPNAY